MIDIRIGKAIKGMGKQSLFISFPYSPELLDIVKTIPNRLFLPEYKCWEVSALLLDKVKELFNNYAYQIFGTLEKDEEINYNYTFKTKPMDHQLEAIQYGLKNEKFMLGDEMGLGKSKEVLDIACIRKTRGEVNKVLVICGINSLKQNWVSEVKKHTNEKAWILGQRKGKRSKKYKVGSTADKIEDLRNLPDDYMFIITNIESFRNLDVCYYTKQACDSGLIDMIILDEAHTIRNPDSQQAKGLLGYSKKENGQYIKINGINAKYMIAMSGTFILNKPLDLYAPMHFVDIYKDSYYRFKSIFTITDGFGNIGVRNNQLLRQLTSQNMLRRLKGDVLDLPEKLYKTELLEMSSKQEEIYDAVIEGLRADIDRIKLSHNPMAEMLRARQATGYTGLLSSTVMESVKMDRLEELVEEISRNGYKCIVYSQWAEMIKVAASRLKKYNPAIIMGENGDSKNYDEEMKFHSNPNCKVICGTIGKLGTGLTLNEANYVIFLDSPWTKGVKEQAVDRCHRIGQINNVTIITLVCKNTIDEKVEEIIEDKGAMSDMLIDGKVTNQNRLVEWLLYE